MGPVVPAHLLVKEFVLNAIQGPAWNAVSLLRNDKLEEVFEEVWASGGWQVRAAVCNALMEER